MRQRSVRPALVVGVLCVSFAAIFFRLAEGTHPLVLAGTRMLAASVMLSPFLLRALRRGTLTRPHVVTAVAAGFAYAVHFGAFVSALFLTTVAATLTLATTTPILLTVVALITGRDRPGRMQYVAIAVGMVGIYFVAYSDAAAEGALAGDALAFPGHSGDRLLHAFGTATWQCAAVWAFSCIATLVAGVLLFATALALGVPIRVSQHGGLWVCAGCGFHPTGDRSRLAHLDHAAHHADFGLDRRARGTGDRNLFRLVVARRSAASERRCRLCNRRDGGAYFVGRGCTRAWPRATSAGVSQSSSAVSSCWVTGSTQGSNWRSSPCNDRSPRSR